MNTQAILAECKVTAICLQFVFLLLNCAVAFVPRIVPRFLKFHCLTLVNCEFLIYDLLHLRRAVNMSNEKLVTAVTTAVIEFKQMLTRNNFYK